MDSFGLLGFLASVSTAVSWIAARSLTGLIDDLSIGGRASVTPGEPVLRLLGIVLTVSTLFGFAAQESASLAEIGCILITVVMLFILVTASVATIFAGLTDPDRATPEPQHQ